MAVFAGICLVLAILAAYANSFSGPFIFDDIGSIPENPSLHSVLGSLLPPGGGKTISNRPLLNFSFAFNHAVSGENVWSYHALNLVLHMLAALTLFGILRHTLRFRPAHAFAPRDATFVAVAVALLWALHPLQTESVTYIVQRAESLMGLFYLLTLYCFVRGATTGGAFGEKTGNRARPPASPDRSGVPVSLRRRWLWHGLSVAACLAGVLTKEVAATAPLIVLLYDRTFVAGSFREAWRKRRGYYLALASAWVLLLGVLTFHQGWNRNGTAGFGTGIDMVGYWMTQTGAIVHYLWLSVWPHPLVFDYGTGLVRHGIDIWPEAALLLLLVCGTVIACRRWPAWGFPAAWFFIILSVTSVVPVTTQVAAEHRLYLPLAAVTTYAVLGVRAAIGRKSWLVLALLAVVLGALTSRRNEDYRSAEAIWSDAAAAFPDNDRAHINLGAILAQVPERQEEAIAQYREALRLNPDSAEAHQNLGNALSKKPGRLEDAIAQYRESLRLNPGFAPAHNGLGAALAQLPGRLEDAVVEYREALRLDPDYAEAHNNLAVALSRIPGRLNEAIIEYRESLRLRPDDSQTHYNMGLALSLVPGRLQEGIAHLRESLRLNPEYPLAWRNLGAAYYDAGDLQAAATAFREEVRLSPDDPEARQALSLILRMIEQEKNR